METLQVQATAINLNTHTIKYLLQNINNAVISLSADFNIIDINTEAESILQCPRTFALNQNYFALCKQNNLLPLLPKNVISHLQKNPAISLNTETRATNGTLIQWSVIAFHDDSKERVVGFFLLGMTTSAIQIDGSQSTTEDFSLLQSIVAHLPGHVYWKDINGVYIGCNERMAKMAGLNSRYDVVGKTDYEMTWKEVAAELQANDRAVIESAETHVMEEAGLLADGTVGIFTTLKTPLLDANNKIIGVLGVSIDITQQKHVETALRTAKERAERAETASLSKSQFLAVMSHELRTPLNTIMGTAQILRARIGNHKNFVDDILSASKVLLSLINDVLDFAKLEAGKIELFPKPIDLRDLVEDTANIMSVLVKEKGLELLIDYNDNVPRYVIADSRRIRQILFNLIGNAIKFTDRGHILISVSAKQILDNEASLLISIKDTGIGIPHDKLDFIFERFNQLDTEYSSSGKGTGLGLAIVKQLVDTMDGQINVESIIGQGSTFNCDFKFTLSEADQITTDLITCQKTRILIVDDNEIRANNLIQQISSPWSIAVTSQNALSVLIAAAEENNPFSIVIIDDQIQNDSVNDLATQINETELLNKPTLILTSKTATIAKRNSAACAGFSHCIIKPVQPSELLQTLAIVINERNAKEIPDHSTIVDQHFPRVLVVEDNLMNQRVAQVMLEDMGCVVTLADSAAKALSFFNEKFDIVFADIGLGDMDGFKLAEKLRAKETSSNHTPIVALTAHAFASDKQRCFDSGMVDVLIKPVSQEELRTVIKRWVSTAKLKANY